MKVHSDPFMLGGVIYSIQMIYVQLEFIYCDKDMPLRLSHGLYTPTCWLSLYSIDHLPDKPQLQRRHLC